MEQINETYKLADLKEFLSTLSEEQLQQPVRIASQHSKNGELEEMEGHFINPCDIYLSLRDKRDCGALADLKNIHGENFREEDYKLSTPEGIIFLY